MELTTDEVRLPAALRIAGRVYDAIQRLGLEPLPLDRNKLERRAMAKTGLRDFGEPDHRPGLDRFIESLNATGDLGLLGRVAVRAYVLARLESRLRIQDFCQRYPNVREQRIVRPLVVIGLPRTGTTILHNLLVQSTGGRAPLYWELTEPLPPPRPETRSTDPRIAQAARGLEQLHRLMPEMRKIHPLGATLPEECLPFLYNSFLAWGLHVFAHVPAYDRWLLEQDMLPAYRFHKLQYQILQYAFPTPLWVIKSPVHLLALDALLDVYPDACIVQTHRDPKKSLASLCSLVATMNAAYCRRVQSSAIGPHLLEMWRQILERSMKVREHRGGAPFFDLQYHDFMRDPIAAVRSIHGHFGLPFGPDTEERLRAYLAQNPKDKHGAHRYTLERFGLSAEQVDQQLAPYRERFSIPREGPA